MDELRRQLAHTEERLDAEIRRAARLEERLEATTTRVTEERNEKEQARQDAQQAREDAQQAMAREVQARQDARLVQQQTREEARIAQEQSREDARQAVAREEQAREEVRQAVAREEQAREEVRQAVAREEQAREDTRVVQEQSREEVRQAVAREEQAKEDARAAQEQSLAREERTREQARQDVQQALTREEQALAREERAKEEASYFARQSIELTRKMMDMYERWVRSHGRSIENPEAGGKTPVVALLNASDSPHVRDTHRLPLGEFPLMFKIVEGQKNHHVKREIEKLQALGCGELVSPEYYANGITLQDSIRKRINDWILEQINAGNGVEVVDIVHRPATFGKYVRFGVFAFRVYSRAFRVHGIRGFFISTVQNLQDTPADDLQPIADQALMDRAGRFLQQQE